MREVTKEELIEELEELKRKIEIAIEIICEKQEQIIREEDDYRLTAIKWDSLVLQAEEEIDRRYNHFKIVTNKGYF